MPDCASHRSYADARSSRKDMIGEPFAQEVDEVHAEGGFPSLVAFRVFGDLRGQIS